MGKRCIHYRLGQNLNEVWGRGSQEQGLVPMLERERGVSRLFMWGDKFSTYMFAFKSNH